MADVSVLNKFTFIFQLFGLQSFSLTEKGNEKYPKPLQCLFLAFCMICATLLIIVSRIELHVLLSYTNVLDLVIGFLTYANYIFSIYYCLISSFSKRSKFIGFFWKSQQISKLCFDEFIHKIDFRKLSKRLTILTLLFFLLFLYLLQYNSRVALEEPEYAYLLLFLAIREFFSNVIIFRFYFYVSIVELHLKEIEIMMSEFFNDNFEAPKARPVGAWTVNSKPIVRITSETRKLLMIRKKYLLIKKMANDVDDTMGFIILLRLFMFVSFLIRFGYIFLKKITGMMAGWSEIEGE